MKHNFSKTQKEIRGDHFHWLASIYYHDGKTVENISIEEQDSERINACRVLCLKLN